MIKFPTVKKNKCNYISDYINISAYYSRLGNIPKCYFYFSFFNLSVEITQRIKNVTHINKKDAILFFENAFKIYNFKSYFENNYVSWIKILSFINLDKIDPLIISFLNQKLNKFQFPNTGMHGDFHPGNILIDNSRYYWIIDFENLSNEGSIIWDLCNFFCNIHRKNSNPNEDINFIYNKLDNTEYIIEILSIYSLMKFRNDYYKHNRDISICLKNFECRIFNLIKINNLK